MQAFDLRLPTYSDRCRVLPHRMPVQRMKAILERRLRPATLHVFAENGPARAFYERFGFRQVDAWWDGQNQALNLLYRLE
jgi:RimJ/RimL family protein N-acetyltransferase